MPSVAAEMAVPLPFNNPATDVIIVMAGVVVDVATEPPNPLADTTDTDDTEPLPFELKALQSAAVSKPLLEADADGILSVNKPPKDAGEPLTLASVPDVPNVNPMVEFVSDEFPILLNVFVDPDRVLLVNVCASSVLANVLVVAFALYLKKLEVELYHISPLANVEGSLAAPVNRISELVADAANICLLPLVYVLD